MRRPGTMARIPVLAAALLAVACERPFVDVRPPDIEILEPDPASVIPDAEILLRVKATSFRGVSRVLVDGQDAEAEGPDTWSLPLTLTRGMNTFVLEAIDPETVSTVDTLRLLRLSLGRQPGPAWSAAVGGHTATRLGDGRLLLAGGAATPDGPATGATWLLDLASGHIAPGPPLIHARTGHTATLLPDGRLVIVGGARADGPDSVGDLVEAVEVLGPDGEAFSELPVRGDPVRRAFHTAELRMTESGPVVDILGGTGDVRYGQEPRLDVRDDLRSFRVHADSAVALVPWFGVFLDAMTGHTQTALHVAGPGSPNRFLLSGTVFGLAVEYPVNYVMDTRSPPGILLDPVSPPVPVRNEHVAVRLGDGRVLLLGGRTPDSDVDGAGALFDLTLGRYLRVSEGVAGTPEPRRRHTATLLPDGRILLMGGFDATGAAETTSDRLYIE